MAVQYPKVLIIGQYFDLQSGGGITLTNLFKGWDPDRIAVASANISNPDFSICRNFYQLGHPENCRRFPFNLNRWGKKAYSGRIQPVAGSVTQSPAPPMSAAKLQYLQILSYSGIVHYKNKYVLSESFIQWIKEFSPDVIYSFVGSLQLINLLKVIRQQLGIPIAVHIMDDWPETISRKGFMSSYWHAWINRELKELLKISDVLMSISEDMSTEYKRRYGLAFTPFHNPIETKEWLPFSRKSWETTGALRILYTGRIGKANEKAILFMAQIIHGLNAHELRYNFDLYTPDFAFPDSDLIRKCKGVNLKSPVPYHTMPSTLPGYDILFLPLDFDEEGVRYAQYSMPTKVSEYMISGTPVLVFADRRTALAKYALRDGWAYVVSENTEAELSKGITELISNVELRRKLAEKAVQTAIQNENAEIVRENFRKCILLKKQVESRAT